MTVSQTGAPRQPYPPRMSVLHPATNHEDCVPSEPSPAAGFLDFLFQCRTFDPGHDGPRLIPDWPLVRDLATAMATQNRLVVVKSRQLMASWVGCAYLLYRAITSGPGLHLIVSKEERSARELIARIQFLWEFHEDFPADEKPRFLSGSVGFTELGSRILSLPASPHAVRGLSPRTVFWDEMAFAPHDEDIWTAIKPAADAGGQFIGVSTPNGPVGVFGRLVHESQEGFHIHRMHYADFPGRDDAWEARARAGLSEARWRREQELSFEGAEGRVYDQFDAAMHLLADPFVIPEPGSGARFYRGIDFGYRRPAVVWLTRQADGSLTVFDSLVGDRWPLDQLVQEIRRVDARHGLSERDMTWTAVDPAGASKTDQGISPVEHLQAAGFKLVWRPSSIAPGIEVVRALLRDASGQVRLQVDPKRCGAVVRGFQGYAWGPDGETPVKDGEHDHPMDALRYLLVNLYTSQHPRPGPSARVGGLPPPPRNAPI